MTSGCNLHETEYDKVCEHVLFFIDIMKIPHKAILSFKGYLTKYTLGQEMCARTKNVSTPFKNNFPLVTKKANITRSIL